MTEHNNKTLNISDTKYFLANTWNPLEIIDSYYNLSDKDIQYVRIHILMQKCPLDRDMCGLVAEYCMNPITQNMVDMFYIDQLKTSADRDVSRIILEYCGSKIDHLRDMITGSIFDGDIMDWDVSNVIGMSDIFCKNKFNADI
jgi:hypothetical protein